MITDIKDVLITNSLLEQIVDHAPFYPPIEKAITDLLESFVSGCPRFTEFMCGDKSQGMYSIRRLEIGVSCTYVKEDKDGHRIYVIIGLGFPTFLISNENRTLTEVDRITPKFRSDNGQAI